MLWEVSPGQRAAVAHMKVIMVWAPGLRPVIRFYCSLERFSVSCWAATGAGAVPGLVLQRLYLGHCQWNGRVEVVGILARAY